MTASKTDDGTTNTFKNNRRRGRSLSDAKERFASAVKEGVAALIQQRGYSRDRAILSVLRIVGRGESPPSDNEIFGTMHLHGLGLDQAAQALTVSQALKRTMSKGLSIVEAVDDLTTRLSLNQLVDPPSDDALPIRRKPEMRIEAPPSAKPIRKRKKASSSSSPLPTKSKASKATSKQQQPTNNRKWSNEESEKKTRNRSDSLMEEMDAKITKRGEDAVASKPDTTTPNTSIRAKRHRGGDELESVPAKRVRTEA